MPELTAEAEEKEQDAKKLPPEKKVKPVKAISFKISKELYSKAENIAEENNLSIGQYAKKILLDNINKN
ncbi:hypothetical protein OFQ98_08495 [Brachyspira hyodysenteriae]|nr:hypothetical protein [Brachyspira hyodysenteriae]MCZ9892324.1 hypothetical protein [Brachyspira hyodysenteriae]MDA0006684.1 hypothetical protein [Brachyspira hyodysenteriae]